VKDGEREVLEEEDKGEIEARKDKKIKRRKMSKRR
jgi:hypothetical protein